MIFESIGFKRMIYFAAICVLVGTIFVVFYDPIIGEGVTMRSVGWIYRLIDDYLGQIGIGLLLIGGGLIVGLRAWIGLRQNKKEAR